MALEEEKKDGRHKDALSPWCSDFKSPLLQIPWLYLRLVNTYKMTLEETKENLERKPAQWARAFCKYRFDIDLEKRKILKLDRKKE